MPGPRRRRTDAPGAGVDLAGPAGADAPDAAHTGVRADKVCGFSGSLAGSGPCKAPGLSTKKTAKPQKTTPTFPSGRL